ncbi:MAG: hydantoin racemase [Burkholderiaceae bacterium]|nr:hydantoin racemase [Burkholderiaceae bacterium]
MSNSLTQAPSDVTVRWLNPVGFDAYDAPIGDLLARIKQPGTRVETVSFDMPLTPTHLEYRSYEALMTQRIVECARDCGKTGIDAMVIGCFYDPALEEAREISGACVVTAPCIASLSVVTQLANKFSVIVGRHKWIEQMSDRVRRYGFQDRLASFRSLEMGVDDFQRDHKKTRARIIEEAQRAVEQDKAEAIVLGCTIEFGFFEEVQRAVGVPVIDAVVASFKHAEHLAQMKKQFNWGPSRVWSCEPPPEEELQRFGLYQSAPTLHKLAF